MKKAIGIDIGGTKISVVLGDDKGRILSQKILPTLTGSKTGHGVRTLVQTVLEIKKKAKGNVCGIGVGIPGPVDSRRGTVPKSPNLPGWEKMPLARILKSKTKLSVLMGNDANAAALGEKKFGQGKGKKDFIYMTVSTGIGSGIVIDGKLLEGASFVAGEVGHMTIVPDGAACKCGKKGCLEAYASGTALARMAAEIFNLPINSGEKRKVFGNEPVSARLLGPAARKGNRLALKIYSAAGFYLGVGLANLLNTLNPSVIILGGGVWKSAPKEFWNAMMKSCRENAWPQAFKAVKIVRSNLKGHSGDLGALALGFSV